MKPLKLTMSAFGPYIEKEVIDFTSLNSSSLFLITGETGSGKTTIFDAMTYALFGETNGNERSGEEMCSDFATDRLTFVELEFALYGKKYRIKRTPTQERVKKSGSGLTTENSTGEFQEIGNSKVTTKLAEITSKIKGLLGLNANQFRQIMMIPQGEFKKLIFSESKEKVEILKTLFKTSRYQELQEELKIRSNSLKKEVTDSQTKIEHKLENIQFEAGSQLGELLSEKEKNLKNILMETENIITKDTIKNKKIVQEITVLKQELTELISEKEKATTINQHFIDLEKSLIDLGNLNNEKKQMEEMEQKVNQSIKTDKIIPIEDNINRLEQKIEQDKKLEKELTLENKDNIKNLEDATVAKEFEESSTQRKKREDSLKKIDKLENLSAKISGYMESKKTLENKKNELENIEATLKKDCLKQEETTSKIDELEREEKDLNKLVEEKNELQLQLEKDKNEVVRFKALKNKLKNINSLTTKRTDLESNLNEIEKIIEEQQALVDAIEDLEKQNLAASIAENLQENSPCPVCGSLHHPLLATHSQETTGKANKSELDTEIQANNDNRNKLKADVLVKTSLIDENKKELLRLIKELDEKGIYGLVDDDELSSKIKSYLENISIDTMNNELKSINMQLEKKGNITVELTQAKSKVEQLIKSEKKTSQTISSIQNEIIKEETKVAAIEKELPSEQLKIENLQNSINSEKIKLHQLNESLEKVTKIFNTLQIKSTKTNAELNNCSTNLKNNEDELITNNSEFLRLLKEANIENINDYNKYKMDINERKQASEIIDTFKKKMIETDNRIDILKEKTRDKEKIEISLFDEKINQANQTIVIKNEETNTITNRNNGNNKALKDIKTINNKIAKKEEEFKTVGALSNAANGINSKKLTFESYILTYFLDQILKAANSRLQVMSDNRYYLQRNTKVTDGRKHSGLNLNILDQYTGKLRSVKTLSGGESFKASLAMALGLADIVQMNAGGITIDTMFIDEGFGSLDPNSLEQALNCLLELKASGKIVGVISHVPNLKERIHTRLEIISSPQGSRVKI